MTPFSVGKYASLLTKGDVAELFEKLVEKTGSVAEACRLAGIERRTYYKWEVAKGIRDETRQKILEAALNLLPEETLEFVADKGLERVCEALSTLLELVYHMAVEAEDEETFRHALTIFGRVLRKYSRTPIEMVGDLSDFVLPLIERAKVLGVEI